MKNLSRAQDFIAKAKCQLDWCDDLLAEMHLLGTKCDVNAMRRSFHSLLGFIGSIHEALESAATKAELAHWKLELHEIRVTDPLLRFFYAARNTAVHDVPIIWDPLLLMQTMKVVDSKKTTRVGTQYYRNFDYARVIAFVQGVATADEAMRKFNQGILPSAERLEEAGVELIKVLHTIQLKAFESTSNSKELKGHIGVPERHLGDAIGPAIDEAVALLIRFYRAKTSELVQLLNKIP